jgi:hypothetical protein
VRHKHQLTIRGFDPALARRIREVAEARDLSLSQAAVLLLRQGAGLAPPEAAPCVGDSMDDLIGTWSREEEEEFRQAIRPFGEVDPDLWK